MTFAATHTPHTPVLEQQTSIGPADRHTSSNSAVAQPHAPTSHAVSSLAHTRLQCGLTTTGGHRPALPQTTERTTAVIPNPRTQWSARAAAPRRHRPPPPPPPDDDNGFFSRRSRRQLGLFLAGASFSLLSATITRRAVLRRTRWARPLYFHSNNAPPPPERQINGALEALEALGVATVTAVSWTAMLTGGLLWALDVDGLVELRSKVRGRLGLADGVQDEAQREVDRIVDAVKPWGKKAPEEKSEGAAPPRGDGEGLPEPRRRGGRAERCALCRGAAAPLCFCCSRCGRPNIGTVVPPWHDPLGRHSHAAQSIGASARSGWGHSVRQSVLRPQTFSPLR